LAVSSYNIRNYYLFTFKLNLMSLQERVQAPTPPFFQKLRNISILLAAVSGAILTTPVALPAIIIKIAGYLAVAGTVAGAVSQAAVAQE
jgi:hypothetical protein